MNAELLSLEVAPGLKLAAERFGPSDGPTLILSPGGGQTRAAWRRSAEVLARAGFDCVAVDLRGHGESDWSSTGDYAVNHFESDLLAVADILSPLRPVAMVGFSLGGMASLQAAAHRPSRVASLVLVDVAPFVQIKGAARIHDFMVRHDEGFASLHDAAQAVAAFRGMPAVSTPSGLMKNLRRAADGRLYWHWDPAFVRALTKGDLGTGLQASRANLELAAAQVRQPTLLVRGMGSDVVSLESVAALRALLPHLEFTDVAGAGHMIVAERNDIFCDAILSFLSRNMPGRAERASLSAQAAAIPVARLRSDSSRHD